MPKKKRSTRDIYKRKLDQAVGNIETAKSYIQDFANEYHERHPELSLQALNLVELLGMGQEATQRLKDDF